MDDVLVVVPARVASTRLPGKVLADINGKSLIRRAYERAVAADSGDVIVACDDVRVKEDIENAGGTAVMTDPDLPSGTDRVYAAWKTFDVASKYHYIVNVQGDLPFIDEEFVRESAKLIKESDYDIVTPATPLTDNTQEVESIVKPVVIFSSSDTGQAIYFSRSPIPHGGPFYKHVGIYAFKIDALEKFVKLPQSSLEKSEKLEQLRAIENGMVIGMKIIDKPCPISIDTQEDLEKARQYALSLNGQ